MSSVWPLRNTLFSWLRLLWILRPTGRRWPRQALFRAIFKNHDINSIMSIILILISICISDHVWDIQCSGYVRGHPGCALPVRLWPYHRLALATLTIVVLNFTFLVFHAFLICFRYCAGRWWWCDPQCARIWGLRPSTCHHETWFGRQRPDWLPDENPDWERLLVRHHW